MLSAVLTGDIVNSMQLPAAEERKLLKQLQSLAERYPIEFYRGDSFQIFLPDAKDAFRLALLLRCAARRIELPETNMFDIRLSLGLGAVKVPVRSLALAKGEAFLLSGRTFDQLSPEGRKLLITSSHETGNIGLDVLANYTDTIFEGMTARQAATVFEMLSGYTQKQAARRLKKSQATINQHLKAANWAAIQFLLNKFADFIKILSR